MNKIYSLLLLLLATPVFGQGVLVPTFDDIPPVYDDTELRTRIEAIEVALKKLGDNIPPPSEEEPPAEPDEPVDPPTDTGNGNTHYLSMLAHPGLHASVTLRDPSQYLNKRGSGSFDVNPSVVYDPDLDAAVVTLPPRLNELTGQGSFMAGWDEYPWEVGDKIVIQHDFMVSEAMAQLGNARGTNGKGADKFKFTNLCSSGGSITLENRVHFIGQPFCPIDFRNYGVNLEGRLDRMQLASDVKKPTETFKGHGGGYDMHPGPDSSWNYGQKQFIHPETFVIRGDKWVRITYELERAEEGTRIRIWLADEDTEPRLIVASVSDPSRGFLSSFGSAMRWLYIELDNSDETIFAEDQPARWAAFRNLLVFVGIRGDEVLGGKPAR